MIILLPLSAANMHPELVMHPEFARAGSFWRSRRLHSFLLASLLAHAAIIAGFPDMLRGDSTQGVSVLEVTLLAPQPRPAAAVAPEPVPEPPVVRPEPQLAPRPDAEQRQVESVARPSGGGAVKGLPLPPEDPEIVGSFSVAPFRAPAPVTTLPDPAVEAAASTRATPPSLDAAYLSNPPPRYPPAARRAGEQGIVTLRVLVLRTGLPLRVEIEKSSGSRLLDTAAQDAVWGWRFAPGRLGTDPVEQWMQVPVRFRLEDPQ